MIYVYAWIGCTSGALGASAAFFAYAAWRIRRDRRIVNRALRSHIVGLTEQL